MSYADALRRNIWSSERQYADEILATCRSLKLQMKLDRLTKGEGNCFMVSILQQLRSIEIYSHLNDEMKLLADKMDPMKLRKQVTTFIQSRYHPEIINLENSYYPDPDVQDDPQTWDQYWQRMLENCQWPSQYFVQATAWFLRHDLRIITTSSTRARPFIKISGNINDPDKAPEHAAPLWLGLKTDIHYQSLLKEDKTERCPKCSGEFKQLLRHIRSSKCATSMDPLTKTQLENELKNQ